MRLDADRGYIGHDLLVGRDDRITKLKHSTFIAVRSILDSVDLQSLAEALRIEERCCSTLPDEPEIVQIALGDDDSFDEYLFETDPIHIEVSDSAIYAVVEVLIQRPESVDHYRAAIEAAAGRLGCKMGSIDFLDAAGDSLEERIRRVESAAWPEGEQEKYLLQELEGPQLLVVHVQPDTATVARELIDAAHDVRSLLLILRDGGHLDRAAAVALLRAGRPHLLLGEAESEWLEVKGRPYGLSAPDSKAAFAAKIELAQDVSRFANSESAAVLVIGIETIRRGGRDELSKVSPIALHAVSIQQYRDVIDAHVYPTIDGLTVESITLTEGKGLLLIEVPKQLEEYKPFLVQGAIVGERVEGAFISVVRRRGEGSIPVTASQLHATLAAGRALLRGQQRD